MHRSRRLLAHALTLFVVLMLTTAVFQAQAWAWDAQADRLMARDTPVTLADGNGAPLTSALFDDVVVYPGMKPFVTAFTVVNGAEVSVGFTFAFSTKHDLPADSLASRLAIVIRESTSGAVVYHGPLDHLRFADSVSRGPHSLAGYTLSTTWPPGTDDDRFQGQAVDIDFDLSQLS